MGAGAGQRRARWRRYLALAVAMAPAQRSTQRLPQRTTQRTNPPTIPTTPNNPILLKYQRPPQRSVVPSFDGTNDGRGLCMKCCREAEAE